MQSFCSYTRTSSVLFRPNKYQIKSLFSFLSPFPKWPSLCFLLFMTCLCPWCLDLTLEVEAGRLQLGGGLAPRGSADGAASFLFRLSFGLQLPDPKLLLLGEMLYTSGIKTITSKRDGHRCRRLVSRMRAQKPTEQKNNHTESFYPIKCVRP